MNIINYPEFNKNTLEEILEIYFHLDELKKKQIDSKICIMNIYEFHWKL
jgi:hypothetical protein